MNDQEVLKRIDDVLRENKIWLYLYAGLTVVLFLLGIAGVIVALLKGQFIWTIPSACISFFLRWPILQVKQIRDKNIALATVPALITKLPRKDAAKQIQQLIEKLYDRSN